MNVGEEICGEWLRHVKGCEFVQYNLKTTQVQGEIDVIGINLAEHVVYACEVALHLVTGIQYNKNGQPDNVPRLTAKFRKDLNYVRSAFPDYKHVLMLWSPVVRNQREGAKHNQLRDVGDIVAAIEQEFEITIDGVVGGERRRGTFPTAATPRDRWWGRYYVDIPSAARALWDFLGDAERGVEHAGASCPAPHVQAYPQKQWPRKCAS